MSYPQKSVVRVAAKRKTHMNLDSKHVTTLGFGQLAPVYSLECVPGDHVKVNPKFLAQVAPLYKPSFGDVKVHLRSFYVPHRLVWRPFEDFIENNPSHATAVTSFTQNSVPYIQVTDIISMLTHDDFYDELIPFDDAQGEPEAKVQTTTSKDSPWLPRAVFIHSAYLI